MTLNLKARFNKNGNIKLGTRMWSFSTLKGRTPVSSKYGDIIGTCGNHCVGCENGCYVSGADNNSKSYRYPSVRDGHARNTLAMRSNIFKAFADLNKQIDRARNKPHFIRIHQSGEIETPMELLMWVLSAKKHPDIHYYTYTKNIDAVKMVINTFDGGTSMPANITINISVWHMYGLEEFKALEKHSFIKAFVYDDKAFDYAAAGLEIETYCTAYDENGKMDHRVTCELCRKCIDRDAKVIGCFDH